MGIALRARPGEGRVMHDAKRIGDVHSMSMRGVEYLPQDHWFFGLQDIFLLAGIGYNLVLRQRVNGWRGDPVIPPLRLYISGTPLVAGVWRLVKGLAKRSLAKLNFTQRRRLSSSRVTSLARRVAGKIWPKIASRLLRLRATGCTGTMSP